MPASTEPADRNDLKLSIGLVPQLATPSWRPHAYWAGKSGRIGAAITGAALSTKMRCFKLLGKRVMARDFDRQVAELQVRAAILNRFTGLGTLTTVAVPMP
jgi:hypothetical protein